MVHMWRALARVVFDTSMRGWGLNGKELSLETIHVGGIVIT